MSFAYLDNVFLRQLEIEYQSPAICPVTVSAASTSFSLEPIVTPIIPGGGLIFVTEDGVTIEWPHIPGALCYTVYRLVNGEYVVVAECVGDPEIVLPPDDPYCYKATALTPQGEIPIGVDVCPTAPIITQHPSGVVVTEPTGASFNVLAVGSAPLNYQWYRNGLVIPGATSSVYSLATTSFAVDNGAVFTVQVSNAVGVVTSVGAGLVVQAEAPPDPLAPFFVNPVANQTVTEPAQAIFTAVVGGSLPISYQWYRNGVAIPGATSSSYITPPTERDTDNGAAYRCQATNPYGSAFSNFASLTVLESCGEPTSYSITGYNAAIASEIAARFPEAEASALPEWDGVFRRFQSSDETDVDGYVYNNAPSCYAIAGKAIVMEFEPLIQFLQEELCDFWVDDPGHPGCAVCCGTLGGTPTRFYDERSSILVYAANSPFTNKLLGGPIGTNVPGGPMYEVFSRDCGLFLGCNSVRVLAGTSGTFYFPPGGEFDPPGPWFSVSV